MQTTTAPAALRQLAATLAYRAAKSLRGVPPSFAHYSCGESTRTPVRIVAHMADLMEWGTSIAKGGYEWKARGGNDWNTEVDRFFAHLPFDAYAAHDESEFFAVTSEAFFVAPARLQQAFPEWYALLAQFFLQNPLDAGA